MNLRQLEAFREVMATGSISAAAARLCVSQPSISRMIYELEQSTGLDLFDHRRGKVVARQEAMAFLEEVERAFYSLTHLRRAADEIRTSGGMRLRIASFPAFGHGLLPQIVVDFRRQSPHTRMSLSIYGERSVIEALSTGAVDIGIVGTGVSHAAVKLERRFTGQCVCVLPPTHALASEEMIDLSRLGNDAIIWLDSGSQIAPALRRVVGSQVRAPLEVNLGITAYQLVKKGLGVALLDPWTAASNETSDLVVRPVTPSIMFEFSVLSSLKAQSHIGDGFLDLLIEHCERTALP